LLRLGHHTEEVATPDLLDILVAVTLTEQLAGEMNEFGTVCQARDSPIAIEVGTQSHMVDAHHLDGMLEVGDDVDDRRLAVLAQETVIDGGLRHATLGGRKGPKVFAGEYACHARGKKWNHFYASLLEAAFMTGLERNADIVHMATYAPLFAHVEGWQWRPDLIWFDNLNTMRTVSYYVQQLYSQYKGANALTLTMDKKNVTGADGQNGLFASAVADGNKVYVKVVNTSDKAQSINLNFTGMKKNEVLKGVKCIRLTTDKLEEDNIEDPTNILPEELAFNAQGQNVNVTVEPLCFRIFVLEK
ncbi:MAG: hypothetical protein II599_01520, partial [Bacteroidales bacterium]|nr:hypothetical protein [Bacteroidales bacterium]